ncbi:MAG TPA: N-acetyl-gamma-glutamyl-phosphate reductase, partial [Candidatus Methylomirabilis sp.]|nr:N-acetyl-gamma-glutamyl-phosphate reductase [Candidatus Methylomirabilis sp.]
MQKRETQRKVRAAVVGATGYTGVELIRLLVNHPSVEVTALTSESYGDLSIGEVFPSLSGLL